MNKTLIVFGSSTGCCEDYAKRISERIGAEVVNVADIDASIINEHDYLILGTSTWGAGEVQDDWYDGLDVLKQVDLSGKTVALFGCGDAESYSDTFCGGMSEIYKTVVEKGATVVGKVDAANYTYDDSEAVEDGKFVGLALDVNEGDSEINERIDNWVKELKNT